jgi:hypothetical protein
VALGVEAIKAARSVYFTTLADLVGVLVKAEREASLRDKITFLCRFALLMSTRSAICRSLRAAAICSSNPSTLATKKAPRPSGSVTGHRDPAW